MDFIYLITDLLGDDISNTVMADKFATNEEELKQLVREYETARGNKPRFLKVLDNKVIWYYEFSGLACKYYTEYIKVKRIKLKPC